MREVSASAASVLNNCAARARNRPKSRRTGVATPLSTRRRRRTWKVETRPQSTCIDDPPPARSREDAADARLNRRDESLRHPGRRLSQVIVGGLGVFQQRLRMKPTGGHQQLPARAESTSRRTRCMASSPETTDTSPDATSATRRRTSVRCARWISGGMSGTRLSTSRSANSSRSGTESCSASFRIRATF